MYVCVCVSEKEKTRTDCQPSLRKPCLITMESFNVNIVYSTARIYYRNSVWYEPTPQKFLNW